MGECTALAREGEILLKGQRARLAEFAKDGAEDGREQELPWRHHVGECRFYRVKERPRTNDLQSLRPSFGESEKTELQQCN